MRDLLAQLDAYVPADEREAEMRARVAAFVAAAGPSAFERTNGLGHLTASAWVVDPERAFTVLLHHRKLDRWLQPGGHVEGDPDLRSAALREAREETGLRTLRALGDEIYDIDIHRIPARAAEPAHDHFDVRFAFEADPRERFVCNDESRDVRWIALADLAQYGIDDSVRRLVRKTHSLSH